MKHDFSDDTLMCILCGAEIELYNDSVVEDCPGSPEALNKLLSRIPNPYKPVPDISKKTIYDLQGIITRCFNEAEKAEYIKIMPNTFDRLIIKRQELIVHIAHTIVGELYELEIIRKLQPIIRAIPNIVNDFQFLDSSEDAESRKMNLRFKDHLTETPKTENPV